MKYCQKCGNQLSDTSKFCSSCGEKVEISKNIETDEIQSKTKKKELKTKIIYHKSNWGYQALMVSVVLLLLLFSYSKNPTKEDFMNEVASKYYAKVSNDIQQNGLGSIFESILGTSIEVLKDPSVDRNDFLIFSKFHFRDFEAIGFWGNIYFTKGKTNPEIQSTQQQPSQQRPSGGSESKPEFENTAEGLRSYLKASWIGIPVENIIVTPIDKNNWKIHVLPTKEYPDGFEDQVATYANGTFSSK
ncbi:MAG: zinc ribbon domain-containing protein [Bacteroidota bacterium]|nr:zinc ribbon domain-containing protein [Bacteroidota bacterium]